jgi:hypothetical protein
MTLGSTVIISFLSRIIEKSLLTFTLDVYVGNPLALGITYLSFTLSTNDSDGP